VIDTSTYVIGMGAASSIGRTVWTNAAAARAGMCGFREHPFMVDSVGEAMRVAGAPWLDVGLGGAARLQELLFPVIDEALQPLQSYLERLRVPLMIALPPPRPGRPEPLAGEMEEAIAERYGNLFEPILPFACGHAGGILAIREATRRLAGGQPRCCIVAGVDSYLEPETLEWVEACDQLHGAGPENNAWGFIPGEAAGALLLGNQALASRMTDVLAVVIGVGVAQETKLIKSDAVCIGEGLTRAFREALAAVPVTDRIDNIFCDQNGEKYRADEYGFATLRTKERFHSIGDFHTLADCWGDIGAAGAVMHATAAVICHRKRYGKGSLSLLCASSEGGERGAVVIRGLDARAA
jgi:3-oxoacyl-[acyl-carrier-protein] synthase-1